MMGSGGGRSTRTRPPPMNLWPKRDGDHNCNDPIRQLINWPLPCTHAVRKTTGLNCDHPASKAFFYLRRAVIGPHGPCQAVFRFLMSSRAAAPTHRRPTEAGSGTATI